MVPHRWLRLARLALDLVEYLGYLLLKPVGVDSAPFAAQRRASTTIITATLGTEPHFEKVVRLWLKADPGAVIITTVDAQFSRVKELLDGIGDSRISLYSVDAPSARRQYYESISKVKTTFFVATDDRTRWSHSTLDAILAPFRDPSVGGVTGLQEVRPADGRKLGAWESVGALNLARRNVQHSALTYFNCGQVLNLSGRLSAYRAGIFAEPGFRDAFLSELWLGRYKLNTGDDNTLTTWVVRRGWRTRFQNAEGARVSAGTNKDATYTRQLLRWLRDTMRCYLSDLIFAIRSGERRHLSRAISNMLVYWITDFTTLLEVGFLLLVSISRTCFAVGDEEFRFDRRRRPKLSCY